MNYCTQADYAEFAALGYEELITLTDRNGSRHIDDAVYLRASQLADAEIDRQLKLKYADDLPFATVPVEIARIAFDLIRKHLYDSDPPDQVKANYEESMRKLNDFATGKQQLDLPDRKTSPKPRIMFNSQEPNFTRGQFAGRSRWPA